jgi:hypothetical protein
MIETRREGVPMNIGEPRRTIYIEPIEESPIDPVREPATDPEPVKPLPESAPEPSR